MPASRLSFPPPEFSWLRPACRPSREEVDTYAHLIADIEGCRPDFVVTRLHREAELQLWIWRQEARRSGRPRSGAHSASSLPRAAVA